MKGGGGSGREKRKAWGVGGVEAAAMDCNTTKEGYTGGRKGERTGRNKRELEIKEARIDKKEREDMKRVRG